MKNDRVILPGLAVEWKLEFQIGPQMVHIDVS